MCRVTLILRGRAIFQWRARRWTSSPAADLQGLGPCSYPPQTRTSPIISTFYPIRSPAPQYDPHSDCSRDSRLPRPRNARIAPPLRTSHSLVKSLRTLCGEAWTLSGRVAVPHDPLTAIFEPNLCSCSWITLVWPSPGHEWFDYARPLLNIPILQANGRNDAPKRSPPAGAKTLLRLPREPGKHGARFEVLSGHVLWCHRSVT